MTSTSEVVRRVGLIMGLRSGLKGNREDAMIKTKQIEEALGMDLNEFLDGDSEVPTMDQAIEYFQDNSNWYRKANEQDKEYVLEIERKVREKADIAALAEQNDYFLQLLNVLNDNNKMMEKTFVVNNERYQNISKRLANEQNRNSLEYKNQMAVVSGFHNEIVLDLFFKQLNMTFTYGVPEVVSSGFRIRDDELSTARLRTAEEKFRFTSQFPSLVTDIKENILNGQSSKDKIIKYFEAINIRLSNEDYNKLITSEFFDYISMKNFEGFEKLQLTPDINYDPDTVMKVNKEFLLLPENLRLMFEAYDLLDSKLVYKSRGLSEVITTDLRIKMAKYVSDEDVLDTLDDIMNDDERYDDMINYLGLNKNIRRKWDYEDKAKFITKFTKYGNILAARPMRWDGQDVNKSSKKPNLLTMGARVYMTVFDTQSKENIVLNINKIKLRSDDAIKMMRMRNLAKKNKVVTEDMFVHVTTMTDHGYKDGVYITNDGEITSIAIGFNDVLLPRNLITS